jgi:hypothetical protein
MSVVRLTAAANRSDRPTPALPPSARATASSSAVTAGVRRAGRLVSPLTCPANVVFGCDPDRLTESGYFFRLHARHVRQQRFLGVEIALRTNSLKPYQPHARHAGPDHGNGARTQIRPALTGWARFIRGALLGGCA